MRGHVTPGTDPLLVEVGCEELPARFLTQAERALGEKLAGALDSHRLRSSGAPPVQTYSTPRRLTVWVPGVLTRQPDAVDEVVGPPARVAFDEKGTPTKAAASFASKNAASVRDLVRVTTPRGEYVGIRRRTPGRPAIELLREAIPAAVAGLEFPKSMYWLAKSGPRFARPIRWVLALFGEGARARKVTFELAGVKSGDTTFGHRITGPRPFRVRGLKDYLKTLGASTVEIDPEARRRRIRQQIQALLKGPELNPIRDQELEDWHVNSCEWPAVLVGSFDESYLGLPREILVTVMRDHQKYFAVEDRKGRLSPHFVAVINLPRDPRGWIRAGHESVLAARFRDAQFFWNADQRLPLADRGTLLSTVTYQQELGSYQEKVRMMKVLASELCQALEAQGRVTAEDRARVLRAVDLAKCDLTTQMVKEFPELQGVVGGLYARAQGEDPVVADAIYDHYLPESLEGPCPRSLTGALVSLADKMVSVAGGFAVGHEPSGSSDPFALRRAANGIIKVLLELSLDLRLKPMLELALTSLDVCWKRAQPEVFSRLVDFFIDRLRHYLETERHLRYDTVRAVLRAGWDPPVDALRRGEAMEAIRDSEDFAALSVAAKRIKNILTKSASEKDWEPGDVDSGTLEEPAEKALHSSYLETEEEAGKLRARGDYLAVLATIAKLRPAVDRFFDKVLVMALDPQVRQNRLRLLGKLDSLFSVVAHFAEIAAPRANVDASTSRRRKARGGSASSA